MKFCVEYGPYVSTVSQKNECRECNRETSSYANYSNEVYWVVVRSDPYRFRSNLCFMLPPILCYLLFFVSALPVPSVFSTTGSRENAVHLYVFLPPKISAEYGAREVIKIKRKDDNVSRRAKQGQRIIWQSHQLIRSDGCSGEKITRVAWEVSAVWTAGRAA
jgi:hypothetical protein